MATKYYLVNDDGMLDCQPSDRDGWFNDIDGIAWSSSGNFGQLGKHFAVLSERDGQQVITASVAFRTIGKYNNFLNFVRQKRLKIRRIDGSGEIRYIDVQLSSIKRNEVKRSRHDWANVDVDFTTLSPWYKAESKNNQSAPYEFEIDSTGGAILRKLTIYGIADNPQWTLSQTIVHPDETSEVVVYAKGRWNNYLTTAEQTLTINAKPTELAVTHHTATGDVDGYGHCDMTLQTFLRFREGKSTLTVSSSSEPTQTLRYDAEVIQYELL